jgi:hypothetical protein
VGSIPAFDSGNCNSEGLIVPKLKKEGIRGQLNSVHNFFVLGVGANTENSLKRSVKLIRI